MAEYGEQTRFRCRCQRGTQLEPTERLAYAGESDDDLLDQRTLFGVFVRHVGNEVVHELEPVVLLMMRRVSGKVGLGEVTANITFMNF